MATDPTLEEKFQGCLVGGLLGDCLGAPFETDLAGSNIPGQQTFFQNLLKHAYHYTDDSAMTFCLARSLLAKRKFDPLDVAKRFTHEYFQNELIVQEYGNAVRDVFRKLKNSNYADPYKPATEQFGGRGSYGNGASMRVAPVALFFHNDLEKMVEVARSQAMLTHSNKTGYNAAIMQCMATAIALKSNPKTPLDLVAFVDYLIAFMDKLEEPTDGFKPLCFKLMLIKKIVSDPSQDPSPTEVARMLGNDITAQGSVPTAIYSFLRSQRPLTDFDVSTVCR
ncbi:unnamed protein product [Ixodes hexagonus]